jgi:hypothetical protein
MAIERECYNFRDYPSVRRSCHGVAKKSAGEGLRRIIFVEKGVGPYAFMYAFTASAVIGSARIRALHALKIAVATVSLVVRCGMVLSRHCQWVSRNAGTALPFPHFPCLNRSR